MPTGMNPHGRPLALLTLPLLLGLLLLLPSSTFAQDSDKPLPAFDPRGVITSGGERTAFYFNDDALPYTFETLFDATTGNSNTARAMEWVPIKPNRGSTSSSNTGPGTNNTFRYAYAESSGTYTDADGENNGTATIKQEWMDRWTGSNRNIIANISLQGSWASDGSEGLELQSRASDTADWTRLAFYPGWAYSDSYLQGQTTTNSAGDTIRFSQDGGWITITYFIPSDSTQVRFRPVLTSNSGSTRFHRDIAIFRVRLNGGDTQPLANVPDQPNAPTLTPAANQLSVDWTNPPDNNLAIFHHSVRFKLASAGEWTTRNGVSKPYTITGLTDDVPYEVSVRVRNLAGDSIWSDPAQATPQVQSPPAAPDAPTLAPGNASIDVSWNAPADGGSPITGYTVRYRADGTTAWTEQAASGSPVTITGLTNGTNYEVQIRASNANGNGSYSSSTTAIPTSGTTVPHVPTAPTLTRGNAQITVEWTAPNNGGSAITGYTVRYKLSSASAWTEQAESASPATISGLTNGSVYDVQVRAVNINGNGLYSPTSTATPATVPSAPAAPTLTGGDTSLAIQWDMPDNGGSIISNYEVEVSGFDAENAGESPYVKFGLINGVPYTVRVRAINIIGPSEWSPTTTGIPFTIPGAPDLTVASTSGNGTITAVWTAPLNNGGSAIIDYTVRYREFFSGDWAEETASASPHTITGLMNGDIYEFQVRANNAAGAGPYSESRARRPESTVPAAPAAPTLTPGNAEIAVAWTEPNNGGETISGYTVRYKITTASAWTTVSANSSPHTITGLTNGTSYDVQVRAINSKGAGAYSPTSNAEPAGLPSAPAAPTIQLGNAQLTVTWSAPADGGSPITGYTVRYKLVSATAWTEQAASGSPATISGLTNGSEYEVQVRASNNGGDGPYSASGTGIPRTIPSTPAAPALAVGDSQLTVSWDAPADGGSPILGYNVRYRLVGTSNWTAQNVSASPHTITGLTNGANYEVQVFASNAAGNTAYSSSSAAIPLPSIANTNAPGQVMSFHLYAGSTETFNEGDGYGIFISGDREITSSITVDRLRYLDRWVIVNRSGDGEFSTFRSANLTKSWYTIVWDGNTSSDDDVLTEFTFQTMTAGSGFLRSADQTGFTIPAGRIVTVLIADSGLTLTQIRSGTVPAAPSAPSVSPANGSLTVSWTAPADGGAAISGYTVRYKASSGNTWTEQPESASPATITGLTNGIVYDVQVRAINSNGNGPYSATTNGTPRTIPAAPAAPTITAGDTTMTVSWVAPDNGGSPITGYTVQYRLTSASAWTQTSATASPHSITGLTNGSAYEIQVRAINVAGNGPFSPSTNGTPRTVPSAPSAPTLTSGNGALTVSWTAPADGGSAITGYTIRYKLTSASAWTEETDDASPYTITGLTNGSAYEVQVRAINAAGNGAYSTSSSATPATVPSAPAAPTLTPGNAQLSVAWTAPSNNGGSSITGYTVRYKLTNEDTWTERNVSTSPGTITGLTNGATYEVQVRGNNSIGEGTYSPSANGTPRTVPSTPAAPTLSAGNTQLTVEWTAPDNGGSAITGYTLRYKESADEEWTEQSANASPATITGLTNGMAYDVQLKATNTVGDSAYSSSASATPATVPSTPAAPTLTVGNAQITVTWSAPNDGGAAISGYTVRYKLTENEEFIEQAASASPITLSGLTNGAAYEVQVRATNAAGDSPYSTSTNGTPRTVPAAPSAPTITAGAAQLTVEWTAPSDNGGADITGYTVRYKLASATQWTEIAVSESPHVIGSLTNGSEYNVAVRAINAAGNGAYSSSANGIPVPSIPPTDALGQFASFHFYAGSTETFNLDEGYGVLIPGGDRALTDDLVLDRYRADNGTRQTFNTAGDGRASVFVTNNPNSSFYIIIWEGTSPSDDDSFNELTFSSLVTGDAFMSGPFNQALTIQAGKIVTVVVANSGLTLAQIRTPLTVPGTPNAPTLTPGNTTLDVAWTAPPDGGSPITGYTVRWKLTSASNWTTATDSASPYTITGLTNGSEYEVQVRATNERGDGGYSSSTNGTPATVPGTPTNLALNLGNTQLTASWVAPTDNGGAVITGYTIRWKLSSASAWTDASVAGSPYTITGLVNGSQYDVQVRANNSQGSGAYTATLNGTPRTFASAPAAPTVQSGNALLTVSWVAPDNGGSTITGYTVQWKLTSASEYTSQSASGLTATITGLTNGSSYDVRVSAINSAGTGPFSAISMGIPATVPFAPAAPTLTPGNAQLSVVWTAPSNNGGAAVSSYTVRYKLTDAETWTEQSASASPAIITSLSNGATYEVQVRANNSAGSSAYSSSTNGTPRTVPSAPAPPSLSPSNGELTVSWSAPNTGGSPITGYTVRYRLTSATAWTEASDDASPYTISGLVNGSEYEVQVRAINVAGDGAYPPRPPHQRSQWVMHRLALLGLRQRMAARRSLAIRCAINSRARRSGRSRPRVACPQRSVVSRTALSMMSR